MFAETVLSLLEQVEGGGYRMKLTESQRKELAAVTNAANAATKAGAIGGKVSPMEIAAAIEAARSGGTQQSTANVFADNIDLTGLQGTSYSIACAVCKATNLATADLVEATIYKLYVTERMSHTERGIVPKSEIRTAAPKLFHRPRQVDLQRITKVADAGDYQLSMTAFPEGMVYPDELNDLIAACVSLKALMIAEVLDSLKGSSDNALITAYRNLNRGMADAIFDSSYAAYFGQLNSGDPVQVSAYNEMIRDYHAAMASIGSMHLTTDTIDFGINVRRMVVSPNVVWSNAQKVARVRQQANGSYFVSTNEDSGLNTIPTTPRIAAKHAAEIDSLVVYGSALLEAEARAENGLTALTLPAAPSPVAASGTTDYAELLGIDKSKEGEILDTLQRKLKELAEQVCNRRSTADQTSRMDAISQLMA